MKARHIIVLSLAAAALISCARESVDKGGEEPAGISFATRLDATRGPMLNTRGNLAAAGGFNVWAIGHTGSWTSTPTADKTSILNGTTVTSPDGDTWSYGSEVMWPMDRYVSFFAYGPVSGAVSIAPATDGTPAVSFTANPDVTAQNDLMIATPVKDQAGAAYSYGNPVSLFFKHALARISFSGLLVDGDNGDDRVITVKKITLNGLHGSGTTHLTDPVVWTPTGNATASYTVSVANGELDGTVILNATGKPGITTASGYLFLLPQTLAREADDPTMDVTLEIDGEEVSYTSLVFSPQAWEAGKSYNYQIAVSKNDLQIIYIDNEIELGEWSPSIVLQTITLTSDETVDKKNLEFSINVLNTANQNSTNHLYSYFGAYAVNDVLHDITIDISQLPLGSFPVVNTDKNFQQYLMFDIKKLVRYWFKDSNNNPWKVKVINYANDWVLAPAKQTINTNDYPNINWDATGLEIDQVDGTTAATLPATFPTNGGGTVSITVSAELTDRGSIILKKLPIIPTP